MKIGRWNRTLATDKLRFLDLYVLRCAIRLVFIFECSGRYRSMTKETVKALECSSCPFFFPFLFSPFFLILFLFVAWIEASTYATCSYLYLYHIVRVLDMIS